MAMVAAGPMPGSTPIKVPSRHPTNAYKRLIGVNATPKPSAKFAIKSIFFSLACNELRPYRELQRQRQYENQITANSQCGCQNEGCPEFPAGLGHAGNKGQCVNRDNQAEGRQMDAA